MPAEKFKNAQIKLRNTVHKITGQDKLIEQYYSMLLELSNLSDKMTDKELKAKLQKDLDKLTDSFVKTVGNGDYGAFTIESFNPYKISNKKTLQNKVVKAKQLSEHYGIKR